MSQPAVGKVVVLRHDVDLKSKNSLAIAQMEKDLEARSVYYFRTMPESWDEEIIRKIATMGTK